MQRNDKKSNHCCMAVILLSYLYTICMSYGTQTCRFTLKAFQLYTDSKAPRSAPIIARCTAKVRELPSIAENRTISTHVGQQVQFHVPGNDCDGLILWFSPREQGTSYLKIEKNAPLLPTNRPVSHAWGDTCQNLTHAQKTS